MTPKLQKLLLLSIPLFVAHGLEEILTGFYNIDSQVEFWLGRLNSLPTPQATFILFQIMLWLLLIISFLLLLGEKWQFRILAIAGVIYIYELHHIIKAVLEWGYYPGLITALVFPIVAYFFWREWFRTLKANKKV